MNNSQKIPPYNLVRALGWLRNLLLRLNRALFPAQVVLYEQFQSFWLLQPLYVAAELNIADHLNIGPLSVAELAVKTASNPESLYRVLRTLASEGIFKESDGRYFSLNSRARSLLSGEGGMRNMIIHHLGAINWAANGNLLHAVRTGESAFSGLYGQDIYPYLSQNRDELSRFEKSMSDLSGLATDPVLSRFGFHNFRIITDIGGGEGSLLSRILDKYPDTRGLVFDLPENTAKAKEFIEAKGLSSRMKFVPGNFLEPFRIESDVFILKNVLHNWDDEHCLRILNNLRNAVTGKPKVLILEMVVPGPGICSYSKMIDIQMLATLPGGRERTKIEFTTLLKNAGFHLNRIIPTIAPLSILEAVGE